MTHSVRNVILFSAGIVAIAALFIPRPKRIAPAYIPLKSAAIPNPYHEGTLEPALRQTAEVATLLRQNNGNFAAIPPHLRYIQDTQFSDDPFIDSGVYRRCFSDFGPNGSGTNYKHLTKDQVVVVYNGYYRRNYQHGTEQRCKPEGYFLVGWGDGRVEAIAAKDVRVVHPHPGWSSFYYVYPGMKEWKADGVRLHEFEFANGYKAARAEAKAFFRAS